MFKNWKVKWFEQSRRNRTKGSSSTNGFIPQMGSKDSIRRWDSSRWGQSHFCSNSCSARPMPLLQVWLLQALTGLSQQTSVPTKATAPSNPPWAQWGWPIWVSHLAMEQPGLQAVWHSIPLFLRIQIPNQDHESGFTGKSEQFLWGPSVVLCL